MREPSRDAQAEDASWMTGLTREPASASDHSRLSAADIASELTGLVLPAELSMAERVQARADAIRVVTDQNRRDLGELIGAPTHAAAQHPRPDATIS
jgi:hypothetical protein